MAAGKKAGRAPIPVPPVVASAAAAVGRDAFLLQSELVDAYFVRRSPVLFVTFDNLASVGEYDPPQPWLQIRAADCGFSILGLIAKRKDWYRNEDAPRLLTELAAAGLFQRFERIVFTGTSMGGYAALTLSRIVPGVEVLAFSPQSTLSRKIAPFEKRYRYAHRKWDWESPAYLDAAEAVERAGRVWLFYDPFVPEDKAHAARLDGPNVRHLRCRHFGHRAIRMLKSCGVLDDIFRDIGEGRFDERAFFSALRTRRDVHSWRKALVGELTARGHPQLALRACDWIEAKTGSARYIRRVREDLAPEPQMQDAASPAPEQPPVIREITIDEGDPQDPFSGRIMHLRNALAVPERGHDAKLASGVLLSDGSYCDLSRAWIRARKAMPEPTLTPGEPIADLAGRHLYAGHMRGHFGHFLVESTARLWALGWLEGEMDGIVYLPYRGPVGPANRAIGAYRFFFDQLGIELPIRAVDGATRVEELYVPELGFGWLERYAGSPAYRAFMRSRLGQGVEAEGSEKLYVSRARLPSQRGGVLGETVIEENLARAGYEIFHPEKHDLRTQLARYKAARQIVALDGSALHLAAYVMDESRRVGMILRRSNANAADYMLQFQTFCGFTPDVMNVIRREWASGESTRIDFRSVGELDFTRLFKELTRLGYVDRDFRPDLPEQAEVDAWLKDFAERRGDEFATVGDAEED
ncbi:hypothetical protein DEA8626_00908 [Defluviimonas aquaemixtae]|uniref:Glycosyltransferase 61 catalytic domain-containing protein n=1 Tax=Albidovulum aquaemixtae TaxID=1542388 RepID=A0A2R8B4E8_9RHOB|nr:glycosyltransferase family 61 protein [Defluviimonas aquaemixtae]SPH17390.1 hypothetical protein DEA8626_00908 [Defluviimonas aquaemixtae]